MLDTPLGRLIVQIDGKPISYREESVPRSYTCEDVNGRYVIRVHLAIDGRPHTIDCFLPDHEPSDSDDIESGERLELKSFYCGTAKLSIGMEGESGYFFGFGECGYDYECEYLDQGVRYLVLPETLTETFAFGVCWIDPVTEGNDVQTWYGADPVWPQ